MRLLTALALTGAAAALSSCNSDPASNADPASSEIDPSQHIMLPVSINETMVAMVDYASEPLWLDAYQPPTTEKGWREAENYAYQMAVSGKAIQLPGTGPYDAEWVVARKWIEFANDMSKAGLQALEAARARDVEALNVAGDRLVESCENCHIEFKPDLPSMGVYKPVDYPR